MVVASGLSPSGPIHLGNLREVMTPHLVADEVRRRGHTVRHLISWDDYDRYRKVPAGVPGVDESWAEHIGKPLTSVPAPKGSAYPNWAEHFKAAMIEALAELGVEYDGISQTEQYTSGVYREQVLFAMKHRGDIDAILDQYRTKKAPAKKQQGQKPVDEAELEAAEGSGAAAEDDGSSGSAGYFPYKPYCGRCEKDLTTVTAYDDDTTELSYTCTACGHSETVRLSEFNRGKLVWKVDWPMRWAYEGVVFEPSGVDHSSPGSSFQVGGQIVGIFGGKQPIGPMYAFVGISGMAKMSSSKGGVPTPADALQIMEPQLLRWLYARRRPNQSFKIAFDQEIQRLYDEWDKLAAKVADGAVLPADAAAYARAIGTAAGELPRTPRPMPYRTLASVADITAGAEDQTLRILSELDPENPLTSLDEVRPRLDKAETWINTQVPAEERTVVRDEPDADLLKSLDDQGRESLRLLLEGLDSNWSLDGLTHLVYGVPKVRAGFSADATPKELPQEIKVAQRTFFALLYHLLVGRDTGPRLPTLLLAVGQDRVRKLLGA
ncbi:putative lysyl-tRNA synthetase [Streptomyces avermitilis MA-4680 = NBRC 14893]|uniref:Lysine--tRNA ligase n=1 Tax=Streptomyces avermitilis (strain ATCC 31267 / DSM 46492 / JCM 5070 / NBRC 14893 / NCIMB 12804 / NRRL 8165 / MA-4680) TaxID=227882 RepID=Q82E67_STRAW|nr:putative lysyl-tRNA synthetase [Streptomyces avermitilis MA-4680 = NBRC 14893]